MARWRDGATLKKERLEKMDKILSQKGASGPLEHYVAQFEYMFGLSKNKILEYLDILDKVGRINIESDWIHSLADEEVSG